MPDGRPDLETAHFEVIVDVEQDVRRRVIDHAGDVVEVCLPA